MTGGCPVDARPGSRPGLFSGGAAPAVRGLAFFAALALLLVPLFAHGCHGDDVDHEPGAAPPAGRSASDRGP